MTTDYIAIIDGTGNSDDFEYDINMLNSFCSQLSTRFAGTSDYQRGPKWHGGSTGTFGEIAARYLIRASKKKDARLFLAGYSRGGSSALTAAKVLGDNGISVEGIILFDPVAKHSGDVVHKLPSNVTNSLIMVRSEEPGFVAKYKDTIHDKWTPNGLGAWVDNPIRPSWGQDFKHLTGFCSPSHESRVIKGSHGALGGVGWSHVTEDKKAQNDVVGYTNQALRRWGINKQISVLPNTACFPSSRKTLEAMRREKNAKRGNPAHRVMPRGI